MTKLSALQPNAVEDRHFEELKRYYREDEIAEIVHLRGGGYQRRGGRFPGASYPGHG
jgi:hypothetical protein